MCTFLQTTGQYYIKTFINSFKTFNHDYTN